MNTTRLVALGGSLIGASAVATLWATSATVLPVAAGAAILVARLSVPLDSDR